jgi:hypothetical protein
MNGLEDVYTIVLLDGVPLMGRGSTYALDGLPRAMAQQAEVF